MQYPGLNIPFSSWWPSIRVAELWRAATMILSCVIVNLLLSQGLCAQITKNSKPEQEPDLKLVWAAKNYGQGEQIYFSSLGRNNWSPPVQLSHSSDLVFQPTSSAGTDGRIWAVWSVQNDNGSFLQFTVFSSSGWMPPTQIDTGVSNNKAVTIIVDRHNVPWMAWTAVTDMYPDIYWSRWDGREWQLPVQAHDDNTVPDIQPALTLDRSGDIMLSWQTYRDGGYQTISQVWDGQRWQAGSNNSEETIKMKLLKEDKTRFPTPHFVEDPRKASLFMKRSDGAGSIPLSLF